jgi:hypothetical protein
MRDTPDLAEYKYSLSASRFSCERFLEDAVREITDVAR